MAITTQIDISLDESRDLLEARERTSYNDIVPDELQMELMQLRDNIRNNSFKIGDIALKVMDACNNGYIRASQKTVWAAVGSFVGYSARTIRYFAETANFFGPETRDAYGILPFAHFVFARYQGNDWKKVLDYAMLNPGISTVQLERWYREEKYPYLSQGQHATMDDQEHVEQPEPVIQINYSDLIIVLNDLVERADMLFGNMDEQGGAVQEVARHISAIKSLMPQLVGELAELAKEIVSANE